MLPPPETQTDSAVRMLQHCCTLLLLLLLSACASTPDGAPPPGSFDSDEIEDAVPRIEPRSPYGNPDSYTVFGETYHVMDSAAGYHERGIASWYGTKFHGRRTSSGEDYDMYKMTAAHKTLPLPTYVRVTNLDNGKSAIVRVNDRGPFHDGRIIDLSYAAAIKLGVNKTGTAHVDVVAINPRAPQATPAPRVTPPAAQTIAQTGPQLWLQVGAFGERQNAYRLLGQLLLNGFADARVLEPTDGENLFRVRLGPLASEQGADAIIRRLQTAGLPAAHIVSE